MKRRFWRDMALFIVFAWAGLLGHAHALNLDNGDYYVNNVYSDVSVPSSTPYMAWPNPFAITATGDNSYVSGTLANASTLVNVTINGDGAHIGAISTSTTTFSNTSPAYGASTNSLRILNGFAQGTINITGNVELNGNTAASNTNTTFNMKNGDFKITGTNANIGAGTTVNITNRGDINLRNTDNLDSTSTNQTKMKTDRGNITVDNVDNNVANYLSLTTSQGSATVNDVTLGTNTKIDAKQTDTALTAVTVTDSDFSSDTEIKAENATSAAQALTITDSVFGSTTKITATKGKATFGSASDTTFKVTLGNGSAIVVTDGSLAMNYTDLGANTTVTVTGDVTYWNVKGTNVTVDATDTDMILSGNASALTGNINLKGTATDDLGTPKRDTLIIKDRGFYGAINNTAGAAKITVNGGHTISINNTTTAVAGITDYILTSHENVAGGGSVQVIQNIIGKTPTGTETDALTVTAGTRYTEYSDPRDNDTSPINTAAIVNAQVTKIENMDSVSLQVGSGLEIGTRAGTNVGTHFEAQSVVAQSGSDLFIHGEGINKTTNKHQIGTFQNDTAATGSTLWIDRTTVSGFQYAGADNGASINILGGNNLIGYIETDGLAATVDNNVQGDVAIAANAVLNPYSINHYDPTFKRNTGLDYGQAAVESGVGFKVTKTGTSTGSITMAADSIFKARLMPTVNSLNNDGALAQNSAGNPSTIYQGDWFEADKITFAGKATFDATFGNDNELGAKTLFNLYTGDGNDNRNTYYYVVARADTAAGMTQTALGTSGAGILDNTMFNNQIIKSDMLGEWNFEMDSTGENVLLRFRLLAKHPVDGGITVDMAEPNAAAAARQLDRIRYPFDHGALTRYDGDMNAEYSRQAALDPAKYPNYKAYYIADFQDLLLNIQNVITSGAILNNAIRRLHPEPYADLASINFDVMDQLHRTREQHGISSLFQVEAQQKENAYAAIEGNSGALASVVDEFCVEQFVRNPVRFWAAGFGSDGDQSKVGTEYGYDTEVWGGAVGVVKEWNDFYFGLSAGYARVDTDWKELTASAKTDSYMADAVVGMRLGLGFIEGFGTYAYNDQKVRRDVSFSGYQGTVRGEYHDNVWSAGVRMGYQFLCNNWLFVPTIGVNYITTESGRFTEKGSRYNLAAKLDFRSGDIKRHNVRAPITARLSRSFAVCGMAVTPEVRGAFIPRFGSRRAKATARFAGDPSADGRFTAVGVESGRWAGQVGGSVELSRRGRFNVNANYDYTFARDSHEHNYSLMMGLNF